MVVRLRDVAERARVSVKTVSNVVHGHPHVRPETRARVQAALDELGYRPNLSARSLRRGRSGVIALALPLVEMPYFAELASEVVGAASERGWTVLVDQTDGVAEREREIAGGFSGRFIDGLVLSPVGLGQAELARLAGETPLVLLGEKVDGSVADHVAVDNVAAAALATTHLLERGSRRIAAIGYQDEVHSPSGVAALRSAGHEQALAAAGLRHDPALTPYVAGFRRADGAEAVGRLMALPEPPDAVFCFNDLLALGALRGLAERGVRVPGEVAVIGFDDIEDGRFSTPSLSTISPSKRDIARTALDLLADRIRGPAGAAPRDVRIGFELLARESTAGV